MPGKCRQKDFWSKRCYCKYDYGKVSKKVGKMFTLKIYEEDPAFLNVEDAVKYMKETDF